jgi:uncharacterized protein (DUF488 family)
MRHFTVGYGGRKPEELVDLLVRNGVRTVVDVRLRPERASVGLYGRSTSPEKGIEGLLARAGIGYRSMVELGNLFLECDDGMERYREFFPRVGDLVAVRLDEVPGPWCLLCAERDPAACHRQFIADWLIERGHEIEHLR